MKNENQFSIDYNVLSKNILKLREEHGFTQEKLAEKIGVDNHTISNWETGRTNPTKLEHIEKLCQVLECDITHLFGKDKYRTPKERIAGNYTGLKPKAIENLHLNSIDADGNNPIVFLNQLLAYHFDDFMELSEELGTTCFTNTHKQVESKKMSIEERKQIQETLKNITNANRLAMQETIGRIIKNDKLEYYGND